MGVLMGTRGSSLEFRQNANLCTADVEPEVLMIGFGLAKTPTPICPAPTFTFQEHKNTTEHLWTGTNMYEHEQTTI